MASTTLTTGILAQLETALGAEYVRTDEPTRTTYGTDALKRGHPADIVVFPGTTADVAAVVHVCAEHRIPMVPRGGGTGYTGGSVPTRGGVVISLERMNRILEIDEANLIAVVEPNVITGDLQDAVEKVGLFYPPDPASLRQSVIDWCSPRSARRSIVRSRPTSAFVCGRNCRSSGR